MTIRASTTSQEPLQGPIRKEIRTRTDAYPQNRLTLRPHCRQRQGFWLSPACRDRCGAGSPCSQIRNPKSEGNPRSEIRNPTPPAHPLTQRRRGSQRFAESNSSLRFSANLCVSALSPAPNSETRSPSLPLINTQLQLGESRPPLRSNRFNGFP